MERPKADKFKIILPASNDDLLRLKEFIPSQVANQIIFEQEATKVIDDLNALEEIKFSDH